MKHNEKGKKKITIRRVMCVFFSPELSLENGSCCHTLMKYIPSVRSLRLFIILLFVYFVVGRWTRLLQHLLLKNYVNSILCPTTWIKVTRPDRKFPASITSVRLITRGRVITDNIIYDVLYRRSCSSRIRLVDKHSLYNSHQLPWRIRRPQAQI